ncbi:hypothetical protein N7463_008846 [Penicillium fimorum]|uniref:Uncharacterized protein n=1 Tax=Penicillium fimorum TaxID=1882269 RepID=A0A9W9XPM3_9EURO|nr:hypothetical protein N7463_008846 [Penicillium fimorum]
MRYNLPTLLALCQDTSVHCKWTSQARHYRIGSLIYQSCHGSQDPLSLHNPIERALLTTNIGRIARPGRNKKPILSEHPRNRPNRESARSSRPNRNPVSKTSKNRPNRTSKKPPGLVFSTSDAGFAQFLKKHTSPKHQRVTAGGRIVPMEPPRPPRLDGSSTAPMVVTNDDETIAASAFADGLPVTDGRNRAAQENLTFIHSSTESDNTLHEILPPPLLASTSQFAAPANSRDLNVSQTMGTSSHIEYIEQAPPDEDDEEFVHRVQHPDPTLQARGYQARWAWIENQINEADTVIAQMLTCMSQLDMFQVCDDYIRYVRAAWMCGPDTMALALAQLTNKLEYHERYLREVNQAIALDFRVLPNDARYPLRVYNINERARVIRALDEHDLLIDYTESIELDYAQAFETENDSDPEYRSRAYTEEQVETTIADGSHVNLSTDGINEAARASTNNRGVDIIDPDTGHPIEFQRQSLAASNNSCSNGTGHTNGNNSDFNNMQLDGSSDLLTRDRENGNTSGGISLFNEIQVDRRSNLWVRDVNGGGNVPTVSNDPPFDTNSRMGIHFSPKMSSEGETDGIISSIPYETWTERRPRSGNRISETVPRNFGRNNVINYRLPLRSIIEVNREQHAIELASTTANNGSPTPSLMFSPNADEVSRPTEDGALQNGLRFLQNEPRDTSVSAGSDDEQPMTRESSPRPGLAEDMPSALSFDQQRRSTDVLDNFFDVFVVDVQNDWEGEGSGERRGRSLVEQLEDGMNHSSRNGSIILTMNGFGGDYPDDMSDTPLLSRNSPFGRYSPFDMNSPLSRNSLSRVISRSSARQRYDVPVGGLSSVGSRMISSSLNARRRHDARENVRNARRSLTNSSRLIEDLRDEVPATTALGFDAPDSHQNTNYLPVYPRLIDASLRHTAPPIVNTSRINAHGHR